MSKDDVKSTQAEESLFMSPLHSRWTAEPVAPTPVERSTMERIHNPLEAKVGSKYTWSPLFWNPITGTNTDTKKNQKHT